MAVEFKIRMNVKVNRRRRELLPAKRPHEQSENPALTCDLHTGTHNTPHTRHSLFTTDKLSLPPSAQNAAEVIRCQAGKNSAQPVLA